MSIITLTLKTYVYLAILIIAQLVIKRVWMIQA